MKRPIILILILTIIYIEGMTNTWKMTEESDTDTELGALGPLEQDYASGGLSEYEEVSDTWGEFYPPPTLSPPHTLDVSSVPRPPASLMTSADVVSARRPPSLPLEVTERGKPYKSSEVCGIIKPGRRVKLNRSQAVNVHKLLTIRYLNPGQGS